MRDGAEVTDLAASNTFGNRYRNRRLVEIQPDERAILHLVSPPIPEARHRVIRPNPRIQNAVGETADLVTVQSDHGSNGISPSLRIRVPGSCLKRQRGAPAGIGAGRSDTHPQTSSGSTRRPLPCLPTSGAVLKPCPRWSFQEISDRAATATSLTPQ